MNQLDQRRTMRNASSRIRSFVSSQRFPVLSTSASNYREDVAKAEPFTLKIIKQNYPFPDIFLMRRPIQTSKDLAVSRELGKFLELFLTLVSLVKSQMLNMHQNICI